MGFEGRFNRCRKLPIENKPSENMGRQTSLLSQTVDVNLKVKAAGKLAPLPGWPGKEELMPREL